MSGNEAALVHGNRTNYRKIGRLFSGEHMCGGGGGGQLMGNGHTRAPETVDCIGPLGSPRPEKSVDDNCGAIIRCTARLICCDHSPIRDESEARIVSIYLCLRSFYLCGFLIDGRLGVRAVARVLQRHQHRHRHEAHFPPYYFHGNGANESSVAIVALTQSI